MSRRFRRRVDWPRYVAIGAQVVVCLATADAATTVVDMSVQAVVPAEPTACWVVISPTLPVANAAAIKAANTPERSPLAVKCIGPAPYLVTTATQTASTASIEGAKLERAAALATFADRPDPASCNGALVLCTEQMLPIKAGDGDLLAAVIEF